MPQNKLTKAVIVAALKRLSELAAKEDVVLEMTIYGGAAMMLAYDARDATKDVDAIVRPSEVAVRLGRKVAAELGIHDEWLNSDVAQFVAPRETKHPLLLEELSQKNLKITKPTARYLLAMKVLACRKPMPGYAGDHQDIEFLLRKMKVKSVGEITKTVDAYFPDTELPASTRSVLQGMIERQEASDANTQETHHHATNFGEGSEPPSPHTRGIRP